MNSVMQPLRDEHADLRGQIDNLRVLADGLTSSSAVATIKPRIAEAIEFLRGHLIPHASAEDQVFYTAVERAMGMPGATATMSRDHIAVLHLTEELEALYAAIGAAGPATPQILDTRRLLYGLYALITVHLDKEEEFYVPELEARLTEAEAAQLFADMETAAERARPKPEELEPVAVG